MRVGLASKGEWHRLDEELRPLIKRTLYVPARASNEYVYGSAHAGTAGIPLAAELSDICRVDGAFKLLSSTDPEVRGRSSTGLRPSCSLSGRRPARPPVAWELYDQGARITCGEATVSAGNRNKLIKILRAILNQGRDRSLQDKSSQRKAMVCVSADPANSHFMRSGRYTRFKEWRFIHRARLNLLPLNGTRTWVPAADKRCRRFGYGGDTAARPLPLHAAEPGHDGAPQRHRRAPQEGGPGERYTVIGENQQVGVPGLRPDLVLARGEEALVLDVCCPFDNRMQALQEARRIKEKYAPLQLHLLRRFQRISVDAIVVGCLGTWDPANDRVCRRLCSKHYLRTMKRLCVSDTIAASTTISEPY
ncbi:hypothetical protein MTO96_043158, partial [Rhipicephalus appendiculatus]